VRFWGWRADADLAILVGAPFSPIAAAAGRLRRSRTPYIVDIGDPWVLTGREDTSSRRPTGIAMWRARRAEARIWAGAAGAVVTSKRIGDAIADLFPDVRVLVRPNGYDVIESRTIAYERDARDRNTIHLVHYGTLYGPRVPVAGFLRALVNSKFWERVAFTQYGDVWDGAARELHAAALGGVDVACQPAVPWERAIDGAGDYDVALVIANLSGLGPPSKVFQYMTLPLPRVVLAVDCERDETARYVRGLNGWLVVSASDSESPARIAEHVGRDWASSELVPPASESWPRVAQEISRFVMTVAPPVRHMGNGRERVANIRPRSSEGR
jgi:glycosyltransferase involved in cell wall biosynthesis